MLQVQVNKSHTQKLTLANSMHSCEMGSIIIRSTCNSRDTLLAEALIYRLRGHYVGLRRKSRLIRYIRADIRYISPDIVNQPALQILRNWY